uniref:Uncharacterized protein n=1 Tax=Lotharella globosa TaxID=91324 RepID=A0A7S4DUK1_9EUKA
MDPGEFEAELGKYRVVRSKDWERKWTRKEPEIIEAQTVTTEVAQELKIESFFEGLVQLLRASYGRDTGGRIVNAFKANYFADINELNLEDIEDLAKIQFSSEHRTAARIPLI